jgi:hypothetical protein
MISGFLYCKGSYANIKAVFTFIKEKLVSTIKQLEKKIQQIKEKLMDLGDIHPGSLSKQWNVCGSEGCKCKDPKNPQKHGPYYNLSFTHKGKGGTRFIQPQFVEEIQTQIKNYKVFITLTDEWKTTAMELTKMKMNEQKRSK